MRIVIRNMAAVAAAVLLAVQPLSAQESENAGTNANVTNQAVSEPAGQVTNEKKE